MGRTLTPWVFPANVQLLLTSRFLGRWQVGHFIAGLTMGGGGVVPVMFILSKNKGFVPQFANSARGPPGSLARLVPIQSPNLMNRSGCPRWRESLAVLG
jgi:hypothetical protein